MRLVRVFVCTGRKFIFPTKDVFFTKKETERKERAIKKSFLGQPLLSEKRHLSCQERIVHTESIGKLLRQYVA